MKAIEAPKSCGVYKITFGNEWFYIGCSRNLRNRFFAWEHKFRVKKSKNFKIQAAMQVVDNINFEILNETETHAEALFKESFYISLYACDEKLLNMVGKGIKYYNLRDDRKKVAAFNKQGEHIITYQSITDAEKVYGNDCVRRFFRGEKLSSKGCTFKLIDSDGRFIDFKIRERRRMPNRIRPECRKPVNQYDINGNFIKRFDRVADAVKASGVTKSIIWRVLKGKRKQHKGFIYRYA
jgi:hypothetical protein